MPARLLLLFIGQAAAFESVEGVVSAMKSAFSTAAQKPSPLLLTGVSAELERAGVCGLTGEDPFEAEGAHAAESPGSLCAGWSRGVCCSEELLAALAPAVAQRASSLGGCPGCLANLEATVCALACSPELVRPSPKAFTAELSAAYCEAAKSACDQVSPCEQAVDLLSGFFGPIELRSHLPVGAGPSMVPPAESCQANTTGHYLVMGGRRTIPSQHRASVHVMSIWREASSHALTTLVVVIFAYCITLLYGFVRSREVPTKHPLSLLGAAGVKPRLDFTRL